MFPLALGIFFLDCLSFAVFHQWLVYGTLLYFIISVLFASELERSASVYVSLGMLCLQDFVIHGRVGISVLFALIIILSVKRLKNVLRNAHMFLLVASVIFFFMLENTVICPFLGTVATSFLMTNVKIFINVVIGYIVLLGILGNRSLKTSVGRGRKVWTPNRKDALQGLHD